MRDDSTKAGAVKDLESRRGRTALRGDLLAQGCQGVGGLPRHLRGPERRFQRQSVCDLARQTAFMGGRLERLHEQKEIGWTAAGHGRYGVHLRFVLDPDSGAHCAHQIFSQCAISGADARGCV